MDLNDVYTSTIEQSFKIRVKNDAVANLIVFLYKRNICVGDLFVIPNYVPEHLLLSVILTYKLVRCWETGALEWTCKYYTKHRHLFKLEKIYDMIETFRPFYVAYMPELSKYTTYLMHNGMAHHHTWRLMNKLPFSQCGTRTSPLLDLTPHLCGIVDKAIKRIEKPWISTCYIGNYFLTPQETFMMYHISRISSIISAQSLSDNLKRTHIRRYVNKNLDKIIETFDINYIKQVYKWMG